MAAQDRLVIDDRSSGTYTTGTDGAWRLVTDGVMGGVSSGRLDVGEIGGRSCLRLRGEVSTANNGGFIQAALDLESDRLRDAAAYDGIFSCLNLGPVGGCFIDINSHHSSMLNHQQRMG